MMADWSALERELEAWAKASLVLPFWWRDDDAIRATPALARLLALSQDTGVPLHIAVIPATVEPGLAEASGEAIPLVHGWAHENHAPAGAKSCEFGETRHLPDRLAEAGRGFVRLHEIFGTRLAPVFVPPWNRIGADMGAGLATQGYRALSCFGARMAAEAAPGLERINTHLDPIFWRGTRSLVPVDALIDQMVRDLQGRRLGTLDNDEPYGLLTHHLVHDAAIWDFTEAMLHRLRDAPVRFWRADRDLPKGQNT